MKKIKAPSPLDGAGDVPRVVSREEVLDSALGKLIDYECAEEGVKRVDEHRCDLPPERLRVERIVTVMGLAGVDPHPLSVTTPDLTALPATDAPHPRSRPQNLDPTSGAWKRLNTVGGGVPPEEDAIERIDEQDAFTGRSTEGRGGERTAHRLKLRHITVSG